MNYELIHHQSCDGVAFYTTMPLEKHELGKSLEVLVSCPMDGFWHQYCLELIRKAERSQLEDLERKYAQNQVVQALLCEAEILERKGRCRSTQAADLAYASPLIVLRHQLLDDRKLHQKWSRRFRDNIFHHAHLDGDLGQLRILAAGTGRDQGPVLADIYAQMRSKAMNPLRPGGKERSAAVYKAAMEKLYGFGLVTGPEMRHQASLAPCAMQRQWKMDLRVSDGPVGYRLQGDMTSYGRGLSWDEARVSLAMEMIERVSSFAGVRDEKISSLAGSCELIRAPYSWLRAQKVPALDPSLLSSEVLYADQELNWMPACNKDGLEILVPFQIVFLFANLDEPDLFGGLSSTGLASGMTVEGARLRGLLEVLERDSASVTPYDPRKCFRIVTDEPELAALLKDYAARDIHVMFQDVTTEFGVPCYTAFVRGQDGTVARGTAAGLSARRALVAAMTETPWPYPHGPASKEPMSELSVVQLESLPDFELGDCALELKMLENVLTGWGYKPLYADLTRADLRLPVVRAIVPGLEIACDFDRYSRISSRAAGRVLELMDRGK